MSQERRENCETSTTLIDGFSFCARFAWEGKNNETPCHATGKALENAIYLYCLKCEHVGEGGGGRTMGQDIIFENTHQL